MISDTWNERLHYTALQRPFLDFQFHILIYHIVLSSFTWSEVWFKGIHTVQYFCLQCKSKA